MQLKGCKVRESKTMEPRLFIATKAFIEYNGKILVVRESGQYKDGSNAGKFDVVGGRLKPGERFDESLLREIKEETGLTVTIGKPFFVNEWHPIVHGEQWQIVGIFFACHADTDAVHLGDDHDALLWIDPEDYKTSGVIQNLAPAFEAYLRERF